MLILSFVAAAIGVWAIVHLVVDGPSYCHFRFHRHQWRESYVDLLRNSAAEMCEKCEALRHWDADIYLKVKAEDELARAVRALAAKESSTP